MAESLKVIPDAENDGKNRLHTDAVIINPKESVDFWV